MPQRARKKQQPRSISARTPTWSVAQKISGFIELGRPIEWTKPLLNMTLAAFIAYYLYFSVIDLTLFAVGFLSVAFLWSGLYALNDYTDWRIDFIHPVKKNRPIPAGKVTPAQARWFSFSLIVLALLIAVVLNNFLLLMCLLIMALNQALYTLKPFRLKSRKYADLISGSMINPLFRYLAGLVLFVSFFRLTNNPFPLLPLIFVVGLQLSGYSLYRLFSTAHDKKVNMKSTVALLAKHTVQLVSRTAMLLGGLAYILLLLNGVTLKNQLLGYLPLQYGIPVLVAGALFPLVKDAIKDPQKADLKKTYRGTYLVTIAFIAASWLIFIFLR